IAASNGHVLAFDNLSGVPPWLSDTLCRLTSGGAFSTRRLFTDHFLRLPPGHSQRDRGCHHPPRSCRPGYPTDARTDCRTTTSAGECTLAGVRARTTAHTWRTPRCGRPRITHAAAGAPAAVTAHG